MKRYIILLSAVLFASAIVSCSSDDLSGTGVPAVEGAGKWTIGAGEGVTRAEIGSSRDGYRTIIWSVEDGLVAFNGSTEASFELVSGSGTAPGVFKSDDENLRNATDYFAMHTNLDTSFAEGTGLTVRMPSTMNVAGTMDEFVSDYIVMLSNKFQFADGNAGEITVAMQTAVLELFLQLGGGESDKQISKLQVTGPAANYFVTEAVYDGAGGVSYTATAEQLTLDFETPLTLSADEEVSVKLVVWMNPAMTAAAIDGKQMSFSFLNSSGATELTLTKPAELLLAGKYYNTPSQTPAPRRVKFVKTDGTGSGTSWDDAWSEADLTAALKELNTSTEYTTLWPGDTVCLAAGTYSLNGSWTNAEARIVKNLTVIGGFAADATGNEVKISYPSAHRTIISGDRNGDGLPNSGDVRSLSVRFAEAVNLIGLDITGGYVNDWPGAGLSVENAATLKMYNCRIYANSAPTSPNSGSNGDGGGGGICVKGSSKLYCHDTEITDNHTDLMGGGAYIEATSTVEFHGCLISGNNSERSSTSAQCGGGICMKNSTVYCYKTQIVDNKATSRGGGVNIQSGGAMYLESCLVQGNSISRDFGSAFQVAAGPSLYIANSTITGNHVGNNGGALNVSNGVGSIVLFSTTVSGNTLGNASYAEGVEIRCENPNVKMINCIAVSTTSLRAVNIQGSGAIASGGGNVFGPTNAVTHASDLIDKSFADVFGSNVLADNGGSPQTIMPEATFTNGSSLTDLDSFVDSGLAYTFDFSVDQRGEARNATAATPGACEK